MTQQDMRFGIVRDEVAKSSLVYGMDEKHCPVCHWPTEILVDDPLRRYCTNKKCNAFILEDGTNNSQTNQE